jgi:hypothetical protein
MRGKRILACENGKLVRSACDGGARGPLERQRILLAGQVVQSVVNAVRARHTIVARTETIDQAAELARVLRPDVVVADHEHSCDLQHALPGAVSVVYVSPDLRADEDLLFAALALASAAPSSPGNTRSYDAL